MNFVDTDVELIEYFGIAVLVLIFTSLVVTWIIVMPGIYEDISSLVKNIFKKKKSKAYNATKKKNQKVRTLPAKIRKNNVEMGNMSFVDKNQKSGTSDDSEAKIEENVHEDFKNYQKLYFANKFKGTKDNEINDNFKNLKPTKIDN